MVRNRGRKIGDVAIQVMGEEKSPYIGYETFGMLDEVYSRSKKEGIIRGFKPSSQLNNHPLNRHQVILNALGRDNRFKKWMMRCTNGRAEVLVRMFELKKEALASPHD